MAHIYRIDRPGQNAGITWLAPVVLELHDLDGMEDATLLKQKTAACFGGFIEQTGGLRMEPTAPAALPEKLEPGGLDYLPPGTKITFPSMPSAGDYAPFVQQRLKRIAAGVGISYEALTGDLSQGQLLVRSDGLAGVPAQHRVVAVADADPDGHSAFLRLVCAMGCCVPARSAPRMRPP